jgi:hypothetical protein
MTRLKIILAALYWAIAAFLLWSGYVGDKEIYAASTTPVNHTPEFDVFAMFVIVAIVFAVISGAWWGISALRRRPVAHG